jgi:hypothetical protein
MRRWTVSRTTARVNLRARPKVASLTSASRRPISLTSSRASESSTFT